MIWLLDGNVLAGLVIESNLHHRRSHRWLKKLPSEDRFAVCPVTQGTLLRVFLATAPNPSPARAWNALRDLASHPRYTWWKGDLDYLEVDPDRLQGPKQVTDAWLAALARKQRGKLATLNSALAALHPDMAMLLPS